MLDRNMSTLTNIQKIKKDRLAFLYLSYEKSEGDTYKLFSCWELGKSLGYNRRYIVKIVQYLVDEDLLKWVATGGTISITHWGITEVESALTNPEESTEHFSANINTIFVENMVNSQIQQGTENSEQTWTITNDNKEEINKLLDEIFNKSSETDSDNQTIIDLKAQIDTIKSQLKASKPKWDILKSCLDSITNIGNNIINTIITQIILTNIDKIFQLLNLQ